MYPHHKQLNNKTTKHSFIFLIFCCVCDQISTLIGLSMGYFESSGFIYHLINIHWIIFIIVMLGIRVYTGFFILFITRRKDLYILFNYVTGMINILAFFNNLVIIIFIL